MSENQFEPRLNIKNKLISGQMQLINIGQMLTFLIGMSA
jgi:hypothetical protein